MTTPPSTPPKVLVICSGNICRSPLGEHYLRAWSARTGIPLDVGSAGTLGIVGAPAEPKMVAVSREIGLDLTPHRSRALTAALIAEADHVLCMELHHAVSARALAPDVREDQIVLLGAFGGVSTIADPMGAWTSGPFRSARDLIVRCMDSWLQYTIR